MIDLSWARLWLVLALLCFVAVAAGWPQPKRVSLLGAGLAFLTLYLITAGAEPGAPARGVLHIHIGG